MLQLKVLSYKQHHRYFPSPHDNLHVPLPTTDIPSPHDNLHAPLPTWFEGRRRKRERERERERDEWRNIHVMGFFSNFVRLMQRTRHKKIKRRVVFHIIRKQFSIYYPSIIKLPHVKYHYVIMICIFAAWLVSPIGHNTINTIALIAQNIHLRSTIMSGVFPGPYLLAQIWLQHRGQF